MLASNINNKGKIEKNKKVMAGECIFPFKYKWKTHDKCVETNKGDICATEINPKSRTLVKYGYCLDKPPSKPKTLKKARKRCPNGTRKDPKTGKCIDKNNKNKTKKKPRKLKIKLKLKKKTNTNLKKKPTKLKQKPANFKIVKTLKKNKMQSPAKKRRITRRKLKIKKSLKSSPQAKIMEQTDQKVYNDEFIKALSELEDIMMRQGEPFRARAYHKAVETIMKFPNDITNPEQLAGLPGIGKTIMSKLKEYVETGTLRALEKYRNDPMNTLTKVYGIGPKKAKAFIAEGLDTIAKLKANPDKLTAAQKLGVQYFDDIEMRIPRAEIGEYQKAFEKVFKTSVPAGSKFEIVGSYRRGAATSGDIDMIITNSSDNREAFTGFLQGLQDAGIITHLLSKGKTKSLTIGQLPGKPARRIDLMYSPPEEYAFATLYFTGSKAFNTMQRQRALDLGFTLNEHGMHEMINGRKGAKVKGDFPTEQSIFAFLGMKYKEPTQRKGGRSVELLTKPPTPDENVIIPDMQDIGKAEAAAAQHGKEPEPAPAPVKKRITKKRKLTLKKKVKVEGDLVAQFKKQGLSFLKQLTEKQLTGMIDKANQVYYGNKEPIMTDDQYDLLREYVMKKYPKNKIAKEGHVNLVVEVTKNKVKLPYEMWSMDKIKPDSGALPKWKKTYTGPYVLSCKLDGVSGLYTTDGPEPKLYTRGNGIIGQDITHLIPYLTLPQESGLVIRGEFIVPKNVFKEKYGDEFANPRNFVAGLINQKKIITERLADLDFVAYELIRPEMKPSEQFNALTDMNIEVARFDVEEDISNELLSELLVAWRDDYKYEIDGVICCNDKVYPRKRGNPDHAFAFKMVLSDQIAEVKVTDVIWTPSKDGYLKPRVQVEPVVLGGVTIEYATGFNAKFIKDNNIGVGAVIKLIRSGDVIPHILAVIRPASEPLMPIQEYNWNETGVDIILKNKAANSIVQGKVITGFFKGIGVDGLGPGNIKRIIAAGFDTVPKILSMSQEDFLSVEGFKSKLATKIYNGIQEKVSSASLPSLMHATNLFGRGFGTKRLKLILEAFPDILVSQEDSSTKIAKVKTLDGMAKKTSEKFVNKIPEFVAWCEEAGLTDKLIYQKSAVDTANKSHPLYGKKIVMTGFRDKELTKKLEALGANMGSSVSKSTFVVLVKDTDEDTGKAEQARKLNIPLMTPESFKKKYNL